MLKQVFSLLLISLFTFSCQQENTEKNDALSHLPASVDVVLAFDVDQMMDKAAFEQVTQMPFYEEIVRETAEENQAFAKILKQPSSSGLNMNSKFFVGLERDGRDMEQIVAVFPIADQTAFEKMLQNTEIEGDENISKGANYYTTKNSILTWDETVAIMVATPPKEELSVNQAEQLLVLDKAESIASNKNLQKCIAEQADMSIWIDSEIIIEDPESVDQLSKLLGLSLEDLKGNYLHTFLDFQKGQIKASTEYYIKSIVANDLDLLFKDAPDTDFSALFPSENLSMFFTAGLELRGINQLLIEKHIKGSATSFTDEYGLSFEDLIDASNGDVAVGLYASEKEKNKATEILFATTIADEERIASILKAAEEQELIKKTSNDLYKLLGINRPIELDTITDTLKIDMDGFLLLKDDILYLTSSEDMVQKIQSGQFSRDGKINLQVAEITKKNIFSLVLNGDDNDATKWNTPFGIVSKNIIIQTDRKRSEVILKTNNPNENSLETLFKEINKDYEKQQPSEETKI